MWTFSIQIHKFSDLYKKKFNDQLILEKEISVTLNNEDSRSFLITPTLEKEFCYGYLLCHRHISSLSMIDTMTETEEGFTVTTSKPEELPLPEITPIKINVNHIYTITGYFQEKAFLFKATAISESAALALNDEILYFAEDTNPIHSIYKVLGLALEKKTPLNQLTLLVSSKIDTTLMQLVKTVGISTVISRTAPTFKAFQIAKESEITLIGFARGRKCNVYTNHQLIKN